jgi:PAS domain S-box-containing protein
MLKRALRRMSVAEVEALVPSFNEIAKGGLLLAACFYCAIAAMHLAVQPSGLRGPLFATAIGTALFCSVYSALLPSLGRLGLRWAMLAITLVVWLNSAAHLWLSHEAMQTTNLAIGVIIAGIVLLRRMEFLLIASLTVAAFAITALTSDPGQNWLHYGMHLFEALLVAGTTFVWKRIAMLRGHELHTQELQAKNEAEQNMRRALEADATLRESERRAQMLFALAPVGIALNRISDGRFIVGSKALFEMVNYTETEFANLTYWDITPRDYDRQEAEQLELLRTQGRYGPYEKEYIRKGGQRFPVLLQGRRLTDASGQDLILSVIQDISAQKETEAALAAARDAAQAANVAKSRFLATMSHELRTPLNAILGFSELIAKEAFGPAGCPQYVEYAGIIQESGAHLLSLIGDVLDLSKIEAGKMELKPEPCDLNELLTETVRLAGAVRHASVTGPTPQIKIAPGLPKLLADRRASVQMIVNLISNALKFTPDDGTITVEAGRTDEGGIFIAVTDTGIGMSKSDIPKALAPFSQIDDARTRSQGGTGLGLPIVKSLIELHGGSLVLDSQPGKGTRAMLKFPPAQPHAVTAAA